MKMKKSRTTGKEEGDEEEGVRMITTVSSYETILLLVICLSVDLTASQAANSRDRRKKKRKKGLEKRGGCREIVTNTFYSKLNF